MKVKELDINAICFAILCNFTPICGEERAKEAATIVRELYLENKDLISRAEKAERELKIAIGALVGQCKYCRKKEECTSRKGPHIYCWEWVGVKDE